MAFSHQLLSISVVPSVAVLPLVELVIARLGKEGLATAPAADGDEVFF
jgi:hypothetical protein